MTESSAAVAECRGLVNCMRHNCTSTTKTLHDAFRLSFDVFRQSAQCARRFHSIRKFQKSRVWSSKAGAVL